MENNKLFSKEDLKNIFIDFRNANVKVYDQCKYLIISVEESNLSETNKKFLKELRHFLIDSVEKNLTLLNRIIFRGDLKIKSKLEIYNLIFYLIRLLKAGLVRQEDVITIGIEDKILEIFKIFNKFHHLKKVKDKFKWDLKYES